MISVGLTIPSSSSAAYLEILDKEKALSAYDAYLKLQVNDSNAWNNAGHLAYQLGQIQLAESYFSQALAVNPDNTVALYVWFHRTHVIIYSSIV